MTGKSELLRLYRLIWREEPSVETIIQLETMETVFGMTKDDPLSQMLVLLLRVADQMSGGLDRRAAAETAFMNNLRETKFELAEVVQSLETIEKRLTRRRSFRLPESTGVEWRLPIHRRASPMLSFFRDAFCLRAGTEHDDRIVAARIDLAFLFGLISIMAMLSAWFGREFLAG